MSVFSEVMKAENKAVTGEGKALRSTWYYKHQKELDAIQQVVGTFEKTVDVYNAIKGAGFSIRRTSKTRVQLEEGFKLQ